MRFRDRSPSVACCPNMGDVYQPISIAIEGPGNARLHGAMAHVFSSRHEVAEVLGSLIWGLLSPLFYDELPRILIAKA